MTRAALLFLTLMAAPATAQDLRGHGGPVRALSVSEGRVYSGSFDTRSIVWQGGNALQITRAHDGAVTAVMALPQGFVSGGQDGKVIVWGDGAQPQEVLAGHQAPVAALAALPGGFASAGWDGRIVPWPSGAGFAAHDGQITGLVAYGDGLASVGSDLRLRLWQGSTPAGAFDLPAPPTALATDGSALFVALADGTLRRVEPDLPAAEMSRVRALSDRALLAVGAGAGLVVASSLTGEVWILDAQTLDLRATVDTGQGAVWAVAVTPDNVLTGGADGLIRRWTYDGAPLGAGDMPDATATVAPSRGAEVWQACAVCHTLTPDDGSRAGPSLHGLFGRQIATAPGYEYSPALQELDIVWTPETLSALFELGPAAYTPGSRMPEQRIGDPADRAALADFLAEAAQDIR